MAETIETLKQKNRFVKTISLTHVFYIVLLCSIFTLINILVIPDKISDVAFQNFSFASTVVSIVLAVVSIIYSLWSGKNSNSQYDSIRHIEKQIDAQLGNFSKIEQSISNKIDPLRDKVSSLEENQTKTNDKIDSLAFRFMGESSKTKKASTDKFDLKSNPDLGNLTLYTCLMSFQTQKPIPQEILDRRSNGYWSGYLVAMSRIVPEHIDYNFKRDKNILITVFNEDYWGNKDKLIEQLKGTLDDELKEVNSYFDSTK